MKNSLNRIRTNVYGGSSEIGQGGARIVRFPNPKFQFPNSEFRMGYGGFGIPHHKVSGRGGGSRGGRPNPGAIRNECNGVGHGMSYPGVLCKYPGWTLNVLGGDDRGL